VIAVTNGLKGTPEALATAFSPTTLETCSVHLIRSSFDYASGKDRKGLAAAIKPIYTAPGAEAAEAELEAFAEGSWRPIFPPVSAGWRSAWGRVSPFSVYAPDIRQVMGTTNAMANINAQLRKIIKTRGHFPTDDAATKCIWLAMQNITADWERSAKEQKAAMNQFAILYEDRFVRPAS
jgi:putative transposase